MKNVNVTDPQFVDANGTGGIGAMFGLVSGSIATLGLAEFPVPGLISPESMSLSFAGLVATVGLPSPWGLVTSGGVIVHAHGTLTGADTQTYSVNFSGSVPGTGTVTAYLAATVTTIQQNPFPLTGPPQGHPSFNPNFVPGVAYATNAYTVSLVATTTPPNNTSVFELARTTLTAGASGVSATSIASALRAPSYTALPAMTFGTGGVLTLAQAQEMLLPTAAALTHTLPSAATAGGLEYRLTNPLAAGNWTIAAAGTDRLIGAVGPPATSLTIPPSGSMTLWANAVSGQWDVTAVNPLMLASLANVFTAPQTFVGSGLTTILVSGGSTNGTNIQIIGNGATTPSKYLRVVNGVFGIINNAYTSVIFSVDDSGNLTVPASVNANSVVAGAGGLIVNGNTVVGGQINTNTLVVAGAASVGGTLTGAGAINGATLNSGGGITAQTTIICNGALTAGGAIASSSTITSNGTILAQNGRLRASYGAYQSGDLNAGVILNDFYRAIVGENQILTIDPMGTWDQTCVGQALASPGLVTTTVTLIYAFPTNILDAVISFGGTSPPAGVVMSVIPASSSTVLVSIIAPAGTTAGYLSVTIRSRGY